MTEREIPAGAGFPFGGMTDSFPMSAPPVPSEPENSAAPVYISRREARAAALAAGSMDAAAPAAPATTPATTGPAYDGIASLFPLLGDVALSPLTTDAAAPSPFDAILAPAPAASAPTAPAASAPTTPADLGATQAIPAVDVAAELATPVGPYMVPQSAPVAIVPSATVPSWHAAESTHGSVHSAAPLQPSRPKQSSRGREHDRRARSAASASHNFDTRKPLRQRIFGVGVMVAVGGLFAVLAIPAYADNDAATLTAASAVQTQKVDVANAAASTISTTARDGYTATSAADLKAMYANAMREQNIAEYLQSGAKAKGDDYPWFAELDRAQGGGLSPLGYYYRECVDFVAWRLNRDAGTTSAPFRWTWSKLTPNGGDGHQWKAAWLAHGWPTGTTPVPGSVAWFGNNHVGYVNGILDNGQVLIEEYNYTPHAYSTRVINASQAYYLYAPPANG